MMKLAMAGALFFSALSCAGAGTGSGKNPDTISYEEIQAARDPRESAWEAIRMLRPRFLSAHNAETLENRDREYAVVYLDDVFHGPIESLKNMTIDNVMTVQFLSPYDAKTRFSSDFPGGIIMVRSRRSARP